MTKKTLLVRMLSSSRRFVAAISITCVFLLLLASPAFAVAGDLDTSFDGDGKVTTAISSGSDIGNAVVQQPDEKLVVAGRCSNGSNFDFCLARYINDGVSDGTLDTSFGTGGKVITPIGSGQDWGNAVTTQIVAGEVRIIVAGRAHNGTNYDFALARYTSTGALDTTFGTGGIVTQTVGTGDDMIFGVVAQTDGPITVAGASRSNTASQGFNTALAQFTVNGVLNSAASWGAGNGIQTTDLAEGTGTTGNPGHDVAQDLAVSSGKFVITGYVERGGNNIDTAVARYTSAGALDTSTFNSPKGFRTDNLAAGTFISGNNQKQDQGMDLAIEPDGDIVVAGSVAVKNKGYDFLLARYPVAGTLPTVRNLDFGGTAPNNNDYGSGIGIDSSENIVLGGAAKGSTDPLSNFDFAVARYTSALNLDSTGPTTFGTAGKTTTDMAGAAASGADYGNDLIIQSDNKIVVAGQCKVSNYDFCAARYLSS